MGQELLTVQEAAQLLGIKRSSLYYHVKLGQLHLVYIQARAYVEAAEVEKLRQADDDGKLA